MEENDIKFLPQEYRYLNDTDFFIAKHEIINKIKKLLSLSEKQLRKVISENNIHFPPEILAYAGKISKGENYKLLPYLILDFPRLFKVNEVFAYRAMFWWGHYFSCTFHLEGKYLNTYRGNVLQNSGALKNKELYIYTGNDPWEYDYSTGNYTLIDDLSTQKLESFLSGCKFLKLSRKLPLNQNILLPHFCGETFLILSTILGLNNKGH